MKLAEALIERKALKTKMDELKARIYQQAWVQEGEKPFEDPNELLEQLQEATRDFELFVVRINKTNQSVKIDERTTLMEILIKKDMMKFRHMVLTNLCTKAVPQQSRYSSREIKHVPSVDIAQMRKKADQVAKENRDLEKKIQECNWQNDLL
ncbi:MAG: DIP1984 family protein [Candidatus Riflebacteria bacterium]|nr:DIP1984 family protein [Candidatus Riflebacteria bacterium]